VRSGTRPYATSVYCARLHHPPPRSWVWLRVCGLTVRLPLFRETLCITIMSGWLCTDSRAEHCIRLIHHLRADNLPRASLTWALSATYKPASASAQASRTQIDEKNSKAPGCLVGLSRVYMSPWHQNVIVQDCSSQFMWQFAMTDGFAELHKAQAAARGVWGEDQKGHVDGFDSVPKRYAARGRDP
jgi:hypothetical protein